MGVKLRALAGNRGLVALVVKIGITSGVFLFLLALFPPRHSSAWQNPVFNINIQQDKLLRNGYPLACVLEAGGQFWTTPFTRYDKTTKTGDGYGEGPFGPRSAQRRAFNPKGFPQYTFLRMNGLDSQSCFECHNSIGSDPGYGAASPLIRKEPSSVSGSAGSNSNAFINPCFPSPLTLLIRQPPHVFGSGYIQTLSDEITSELYDLRCKARTKAKGQKGVPVRIDLVDAKHNLIFGKFKTTYIGGPSWKVIGSNNSCQVGVCQLPPSKPEAPQSDFCAVEAAGFVDDVSGVTGVAQDLIVRPFQWKGISSSLRHFVRDALDFHFSMQAYEKVGLCDCDKDGKPQPGSTDPNDAEVTVGNLSAISSFVGMTRPPQQKIPEGISEASVRRGFDIFSGKASGVKLVGQMCATCHVPALPLTTRQFVVDTPPEPKVNCKRDCPTEAVKYYGLVTPEPHSQLEVLSRIKTAKLGANAISKDYNIPLDSLDVPGYALPRLSQSAPFFLPFLQHDSGFYVPLFSDLHTHNMGRLLGDIAVQGSDASGICIARNYFLTRPLWGVADTGPWLHDGRATSLKDAIIGHGDHKTNPGAEPDLLDIIEAFEKLSPDDQQAVVNFLLSLRLPLEESKGVTPQCSYTR